MSNVYFDSALKYYTIPTFNLTDLVNFGKGAYSTALLGVKTLLNLGLYLLPAISSARHFYEGYRNRQHDPLYMSTEFKLIKCKILIEEIKALKRRQQPIIESFKEFNKIFNSIADSQIEKNKCLLSLALEFVNDEPIVFFQLAKQLDDLSCLIEAAKRAPDDEQRRWLWDRAEFVICGSSDEEEICTGLLNMIEAYHDSLNLLKLPLNQMHCIKINSVLNRVCSSNSHVVDIYTLLQNCSKIAIQYNKIGLPNVVCDYVQIIIDNVFSTDAQPVNENLLLRIMQIRALASCDGCGDTPHAIEAALQAPSIQAFLISFSTQLSQEDLVFFKKFIDSISYEGTIIPLFQPFVWTLISKLHATQVSDDVDTLLLVADAYNSLKSIAPEMTYGCDYAKDTTVQKLLRLISVEEQSDQPNVPANDGTNPSMLGRSITKKKLNQLRQIFKHISLNQPFFSEFEKLEQKLKQEYDLAPTCSSPDNDLADKCEIADLLFATYSELNAADKLRAFYDKHISGYGQNEKSPADIEHLIQNLFKYFNVLSEKQKDDTLLAIQNLLPKDTSPLSSKWIAMIADGYIERNVEKSRQLIFQHQRAKEKQCYINGVISIVVTGIFCLYPAMSLFYRVLTGVGLSAIGSLAGAHRVTLLHNSP